MGDDIRSTARALVAEGQGILAADESTGTITKRFKKLDIESTEDSRREYREMLVTTPGLGDYISGIIMYDETLRQKTSDGTPMAEAAARNDIIPGIKVDTGAKPLAGFEGEKITEGLDGLRDRLEEYKEMGARFAKWRAVITIGDGIPSRECIYANAHALARYAALCQEAGFVPIVEPEVLMDGDHTIERHYDATLKTLEAVFEELFRQRVDLEGTLLKTNMVLSGSECPRQAGVEEVCEKTLDCMKRIVPPAIPGIVFLSGGQTNELSTEHLNVMNQMWQNPPWELGFSYARALQGPAMEIWAGRSENIEDAQKALHHRAKLNGAARKGEYSSDMEKVAA